MASKEPAPLNFVHQNAILCETIKKEQKHQKLHKDYRVNPFKKSMSGLLSTTILFGIKMWHVHPLDLPSLSNDAKFIFKTDDIIFCDKNSKICFP